MIAHVWAICTGWPPILRRPCVDGLLASDGSECDPCFACTAMLPSLMTYGTSLVFLIVLAYCVVQFSGYIIIFRLAECKNLL